MEEDDVKNDPDDVIEEGRMKLVLGPLAEAEAVSLG